jgi:hypothetical protein
LKFISSLLFDFVLTFASLTLVCVCVCVVSFNMVQTGIAQRNCPHFLRFCVLFCFVSHTASVFLSSSLLEQLLLDPYYRTIEGFFALINKEWCAFGHKFEWRTNRHSANKESSPTFLQFLDTCHQVLCQYPTDFEFTSSLLVVLGQAAYSGNFTTFRGDSEDERNSLMRRTAPAEDMSLSEMQHSTVFYYIYLLLRCDMFSSLLVNPNFAPPGATQSSWQYLRPKTAIVDLVLWKEGLAGFNKQNFEVSLGPQHVTQAECSAITANTTARQVLLLLLLLLLLKFYFI